MQRLACVLVLPLGGVRHPEMELMHRVAGVKIHCAFQRSDRQRRHLFLVVNPAERVVELRLRRLGGRCRLGELHGDVQVHVFRGIQPREIVLGDAGSAPVNLHGLLIPLHCLGNVVLGFG